MKKLPLNYSRCENNECVDRFNCARFTDKPTGVRLQLSAFPTPKKSGECPFFILNTEDNQQ